MGCYSFFRKLKFTYILKRLNMRFKKLVLFIFCSVLVQIVSGQKPIIDSLAIINWPSLYSCNAISNDGNYFSYTIQNLPSGNHTLVIQKTDNSWKKEFIGASFCVFVNDTKRRLYFKMEIPSYFFFDVE